MTTTGVRSDDPAVFPERYKGIRTGLIGEVVVEFVYAVGSLEYAVNICRTGTDEVTRLTAAEWETLTEVGRKMRSTASGEHNGWQWLL